MDKQTDVEAASAFKCLYRVSSLEVIGLDEALMEYGGDG